MAMTPDVRSMKPVKDPGPVAEGKAGDRVIVGCKLPNGLQIQNHRKEGDVFIADGPTLVLAGSNSSRVLGGFGLTHNVPRDYIERWLKDNEMFQPVRDKLIFIAGNEDEVQNTVSERGGLKHGLEPLQENSLGARLAPFNPNDDKGGLT